MAKMKEADIRCSMSYAEICRAIGDLPREIARHIRAYPDDWKYQSASSIFFTDDSGVRIEVSYTGWIDAKIFGVTVTVEANEIAEKAYQYFGFARKRADAESAARMLDDLLD